MFNWMPPVKLSLISRKRAKRVYNLVTRVVLASGKIGFPIFLSIFLWIYAWCPPMTSCSVTSWSCFQATKTLPPMTRAHFHVAFKKGWCVLSSSVKKCLQSANHQQFPMQMTQNRKHNKWLEILDGEDFPPNLLWRTPTKTFHLEQIEEDNREARGTSLRTAKVTSSTQRPQTCTEAAIKYYNYTASETDEEREHWLPTLQKAITRSGNAWSSYPDDSPPSQLAPTLWTISPQFLDD